MAPALLLLIAGFLWPFNLFQSSAPAPYVPSSSATATDPENTASLPADPGSILGLAAKMNGLDGPDVKPWHLKVSYQFFNAEGAPDRFGTYEEFWVSDKIYKRSYTSGSFTQTDFGTDHGLYRSGNQAWPDFLEMKVRSNLIQPIPAETRFRDVKLKMSERSFDQLPLQCVVLQPKFDSVIRVYNAPPSYPYVHYCFDQKHPILRFDSQGEGMYDTLYNHIVLFEGHYFAREVRMFSQRKPQLTLRVETLENLAPVNLAGFVPPPDAVGPLNGRVELPAGLLNTLVRKRCSVESFFSIQHTDVHGTVVVQAKVGKDGRVMSAEALSGPKVLLQEAAQCARKFEFRPFLVQGQPVEVEGKLEISMAVTNELPDATQ
jgi:hypothetical protein